GQIGITDYGDAVFGNDRLAGHRSGNVSALLGGHIHDHAARLHPGDIITGDQARSRFTGNERGGDDDVHLLGLLGVDLGGPPIVFLAGRPRVTVGTLLGFYVNFQILAPDRTHLIGDLAAWIVGLDDGPQA